MARETQAAARLPVRAAAAWQGLGAALYAGGQAQALEHQHPALQLLAPLARRGVEGTWRTGRAPVRFRLGAGEVGVVGAQVPHAFTWGAQAQVVSFFLEPARLAALAQEPRLAGALAAVGPARSGDPVLRELLRALGEVLAEEAGGASRVYVESLATVLGMRLLRLDGQRAQGRVAGLGAWQVRQVADYVEAHLAEPLGLEALAGVVGLSAAHFARSFKRATGDTPHRFLLARRLERARALLEETALPLSEVACAAGFADQSHFTAHFRARYALPPGRYRRARGSSGAPGAAGGR